LLRSTGGGRDETTLVSRRWTTFVMTPRDPNLGTRTNGWRLSRLTLIVLLGGVLVLVAIAVTGQLLYSAAARLNGDQQFGATKISPTAIDVVRLLSDYETEEAGLRGYLLAGQPAFYKPALMAQQQIPGLEARLKQRSALFPGGSRAFEGVLAAHRAWATEFRNVEVNLIRSNKLATAQHIAESNQGNDLFGNVRRSFVPLGSVLTRSQAANQASVSNITTELIILLILTLVALGLLVLLSTWLIIRRITLPIGRMTDEAAALASGWERAPGSSRSSGDIGRFSQYTESIKSQLAAHRLRSRRATEALEQQGPSVSALVAALEPRRDSVDNIAASAALDPAEGLLAGDWYDLLAVDDRTLAVVVGDVSGHGPASAVLSLRLRELLMAFLLEGVEPGEALGRTARANERGSEFLFATVFCAVMDVDNRLVAYANAGHPPAMLHGDPTSETPLVSLGPTGPLLSPIMAAATWSTRTESFPPGCGLLVVTDGVTEGQNPSGDHYGADRLADDLLELSRRNIEGVVEEIAERLDRFVGGAGRDDRTLVYCTHCSATA
jgi:sigma-B regulation protein RsbU (phosphoserine phosphatase)